jgi:hypothetical protein
VNRTEAQLEAEIANSLNGFDRPSLLESRLANASREIGLTQDTGLIGPTVVRQGLLSDITGVTGTVGTGLTSGFLLSSALPRGGIELSSQRLLFNTVDDVTDFALSNGRIVETITIGQLGAQPLGGLFGNPTFRTLEEGANVANGNLGFAFNGRGFEGKFNGVVVSDALDFLGRQLFFGQSIIQGIDLSASIINDILNPNVATLSNETFAQTGQTALDISFGALGTFGGIPGALISLGYTFRSDIIEASRVSAEQQQRNIEFQIENNIFPLPVGPKF